MHLLLLYGGLKFTDLEDTAILPYKQIFCQKLPKKKLLLSGDAVHFFSPTFSVKNSEGKQNSCPSQHVAYTTDIS